MHQTPGTVLRGTGKSAFFIPKQLTLKQVIGQGSHIDIDKILFTALRQVVDLLRDHFFTRSTFSQNQYISVTACHFFDHFLNGTHRLAVTNKWRFIVGRRGGRR